MAIEDCTILVYLKVFRAYLIVSKKFLKHLVELKVKNRKTSSSQARSHSSFLNQESLSVVSLYARFIASVALGFVGHTKHFSSHR